MSKTFERAWERWLEKRGVASRPDFAAGWREALVTLPAPASCECLTCREVKARYELATKRAGERG